MDQRKNYNSIDLWKLIMAICVVALHTNPLINCKNYIILSIYFSIVKMAVPFFFLTSGFLLGKKMNKEISNELIVKSYLQKILKLYFKWMLIYTPLTIYHFIT